MHIDNKPIKNVLNCILRSYTRLVSTLAIILLYLYIPFTLDTCLVPLYSLYEPLPLTRLSNHASLRLLSSFSCTQHTTFFYICVLVIFRSPMTGIFLSRGVIHVFPLPWRTFFLLFIGNCCSCRVIDPRRVASTCSVTHSYGRRNKLRPLNSPLLIFLPSRQQRRRPLWTHSVKCGDGGSGPPLKSWDKYIKSLGPILLSFYSPPVGTRRHRVQSAVSPHFQVAAAGRTPALPLVPFDPRD